MTTKKYLVVIDMQNDFIDGSLGTKEAQAIVPRVVDRIKECINEGYEVFATQDTHGNDYLDTTEGKYLPVRHCIDGSPGHEIPQEILELIPQNNIIIKNTFGSIPLGYTLQWRPAACENVIIELVGLCTDICVVTNALLLKTFLPNAIIRVNAACCAGVTPELHEAALKTMKSCQIEII